MCKKEKEEKKRKEKLDNMMIQILRCQSEGFVA